MIDDIDYRKSLRLNKLVLKSKWMELIDFLLFLGGITIFALYNVKALWIEGIQNNVTYWFILSPISITIMIFLAYKKINEKRFVLIQSPLNKNENREFILEFVKENGFIIQYNNEDYLIAESLRKISSGKQISFLFANKEIKINCLTQTALIRMPVFIYCNSLRKNIEQRIKIFYKQKTV
jgi:hypothetical protein